MTENTANNEGLASSNELFKNVKYYTSGNLEPHIEQLLTSHGAQFTKFMVGHFTHVICGKNYDETHILEAADLYSVPSVSEDWVMASVRIGRLAVLKPYTPHVSSATSPLFSKFVFSMSQLEAADRKNLYGLIAFHGGKVEKFFTNKTTHLICGAATGFAYSKALEMGRVKITIITPDWITECVKNRTLLNPETFHPRLLLVPPKPKQVAAPVVTTSESLANIIGLDFEESIAKTEVPITREVPPAPAPTTTTVTQQIPEYQNIQQPQIPQQQQVPQPAQPNVYIQQQVRQVTPQTMTPQQFQQMLQQSKQPQNMYTVVKQQQGELQQNLQMQQGTMIVQQQTIDSNQMPQAQEPPPQFIGNTIIRQQTPQQIQQQQQIRMQGQQMAQSAMGQGQQFVQPMPQQMHQQRAPQPHMVQSQQKQQILVNQSFNIQQTRIITSIPSNGQGQQIITQQINPQQMGNPQVMQQKIVQGQMALSQQQQQQQQLPPGMQQQVRASMPGQQLQHRPQGTMIIQNQQQQQQQSMQPQLQQQLQGHQQQQQQQQQVQVQGQHIVQAGQQIIQGQPIIQNQMQAQMQNPQLQNQQIVGGGQLQAGQQVIQGQQIIQNQQIIQGGGQQQQQILNQPGQQFVRAARPQFQRHLIQLDPQTHAQLQKMDPQKRNEYLAQLQTKRMTIRPQGVAAYQGASPAVPNEPGAVQRPGTQHILIRGKIPQGLTQQQQMQWLQQQAQTRPLLVRQTSHTPGLSPITQQGGAPNQQFQVDPNATPQQQQQQIQMQLQRQQYQRLQMQRDGSKTPGTPVSPRGPGFPPDQQDQQQIIIQDPNALPNKTKTALANMLSSRLGNNGGVNPIQESVAEPSAAGTLRLMTAQHNASLNQTSGPPRTPQEMMALQQQRRSLGNITNPVVAPPGPPNVQGIVPQGPQGVIPPQSPSQIRTGLFSPNRVQVPRQQFYGHNPNLKLPAELFLIGCHFFIVEYDEEDPEEVPRVTALIQKYGGEVESVYSPRVTHVLCRTQRHGVVMQAIRDSKRCITTWWLKECFDNKAIQAPQHALHLPFPYFFERQKPATRHIISVTAFEGVEKKRIIHMVHEAGARYTAYFSRQHTLLISRKNDVQNIKMKKAKEWNIPVVNTVWLSDILLGKTDQQSQYDAPRYQQFNLQFPFKIDFSLVPHLMNPWKSPINLTQEAHERVKRAQSEPPPMPQPKKPRISAYFEQVPDEIFCTKYPDPDNLPKVQFSGVDNLAGLMRVVKCLGGSIAEDFSDMTILVCTRFSRTFKFVVALCVARHIVSSKWLIESAQAGYFLPPENYPISSREIEEDAKCDIPKVLASPIRRTLFEGRTFFVTPGVKPNVNLVCRLIEVAGGKAEQNRISNARIQEMNARTPNSYIIIACENDDHLVAHLMKPGRNNYVNVCHTEAVFHSIQIQKLEIEPYILRLP